MEIGASYVQTSIEEYDGDYGQIYKYERSDVYDVLVCPDCGKITLARYSCYLEEDQTEKPFTPQYEILYPSLDSAPRGLPAEIEKAYYAALKVRGIDANAFAVLIGRVLEMTCEDRKATGKYLNDKIADLAVKGEIPEKLVGVANSLKNLRNIGAHATLGELTPREIPILDDLCKAILEYVYSAPYLVNQAESRLAKLKRGKSE
jgi:hypothetical protein